MTTREAIASKITFLGCDSIEINLAYVVNIIVNIVFVVDSFVMIDVVDIDGDDAVDMEGDDIFDIDGNYVVDIIADMLLRLREY